MPGPPPNPNARRTNNRDAGFTTLTGRRSKVPRLPSVKNPDGSDYVWSQATKDAWKRWWSSPQATRWTDDDVPQLVLVARFYEDALRGDEKAMTEFRQWADRFGMTPLARLRNRWLVPAPPSTLPEDRPMPAPSEGATVTSLDEYRELYGDSG